jgi:hypothetical protein
MPHWTTFDEETLSALRSRLPQDAAVEHQPGAALEYALNCAETTVAVLPCGGIGEAGLAVFRWNRIPEFSEPAPEPATAQFTNSRPGGFLGLSDEPVFEEEEKKSWWKRFWEG